MPELNEDEQFKFLISCLRWSNSTQVDFTEVAMECKIITRGAAAKRYQRLMKAHNIDQPARARDRTVPAIRRKGEPCSQQPPSKKRKQGHFADGDKIAAVDDKEPGRVKDEINGINPNSTIIKAEAASHGTTLAGKTVFGKDYPWLRYPAGWVASNDSDKGAAFKEVIVASKFEPMNTFPHFEDADAAKPGEGKEVAMHAGHENGGSTLTLTRLLKGDCPSPEILRLPGGSLDVE